MNFRLARPSALVDITRIPGLSSLRANGDGLRIGALATHRAIETTTDPAVLQNFGVLPRAARWIGHYPIRSRGTFGGSIAHADPASEWCLLALLLGAQVVLHGPGGQRIVPAEQFLQGYYTTAPAPDEMITEVRFPRPVSRAVLHEFAQRQGDFAIVAAAVQADIADGTLRAAGVVVGGVGPLPVRIDTAAAAGQPATSQTWPALGEPAAAPAGPPSGTPAHRAHPQPPPPTPPPRRAAAAGGVPETGPRPGGGRAPGPGGGGKARARRHRARPERPLGRRGPHPQGRPPAAAGPGPVRGRHDPGRDAARGVRPQP